MAEKLKINNRVENCELINFSKLKWFQGKLKEMRKEGALTLERAIRQAFIEPFAVWMKSENEAMILDGHQRYTVMKNAGYAGDVPFFKVRCENEKEAAKFVLFYNSKPGKMTDEGLYEFMHNYNINMSDFKDSVDFEEMDLNEFEAGYINDDELDVIEGDRENSNIDHFYQGNSRGFRMGDLMAYISDEGLIGEINAFTGKIIEFNEDQRYLNSVGETIVRFILKNEALFLSEK